MAITPLRQSGGGLAYTSGALAIITASHSGVHGVFTMPLMPRCSVGRIPAQTSEA